MKYQELLARADEHFARVTRAFPKQVNCRQGCTLCCTGLFEISRLDASLVERGLRSLGVAERALVRRRAEEILSVLPHPESWSEVSRDERDAFFERTADVECPLLVRRGLCRIYEFRPLVCRTFGLPIREGERFLGDECGLNFRFAGPGERETAAWDLSLEGAIAERDEVTIPQAIAWIERTKARRRTARRIRTKSCGSKNR